VIIVEQRRRSRVEGNARAIGCCEVSLLPSFDRGRLGLLKVLEGNCRSARGVAEACRRGVILLARVGAWVFKGVTISALWIPAATSAATSGANPVGEDCGFFQGGAHEVPRSRELKLRI